MIDSIELKNHLMKEERFEAACIVTELHRQIMELKTKLQNVQDMEICRCNEITELKEIIERRGKIIETYEKHLIKPNE